MYLHAQKDMPDHDHQKHNIALTLHIASTFAPYLSSSLMISILPILAAQCKAVSPNYKAYTY